jgi:tetratricopeptide (TPR) repeat protein
MPLQNPAPIVFCGREAYVEQAVKMLVDNATARIVILGPGGIGKTSIAQTILHAAAIREKFCEHSRFVSCEGIRTSASLVNILCAAFNLQTLSGNGENNLLVHLKHDYTSSPLLLILDNFETVWDVGLAKAESEALLQKLEQVPLLSLIVTMRGTIKPGALKWTQPFLPMVEKLKPAAARQAFQENYGDVDDGNLDALLFALDYVPLAVTLMARRSSVFTPGQLLEIWDREKTRMLSPGDQGRLGNIDVSIHISIGSPQIQSTPGALELLSLLALLPGGVNTAELAGIVPKLEGCDIAVLTLLSVGLVQMNSMNILHVLSPIRAYIIQHHKPIPQHLNDLYTYFFNVADLGQKGPGDNDYHDAIITMKAVASNMESILTLALETKFDPVHCLEAALNWTKFLSSQTPRSDIIRLAVGLAESEKLDKLLARCLQSLGDTLLLLNEHDEAQQRLADAHTLFKSTGDQCSAANCLHSLAKIKRRLDHYEEARQILSNAQTIFGAIEDQSGAALCQHSLGNIEYMLSHYDEAQQMISEAQTKFESLGDGLNAIQCLVSLGNNQYILGQYDEAQKKLSEAKDRHEGFNDQTGVARCLQSLGNIQYMLDHHDNAQQMLSDAQVIFERVGSQLGVAQCLQSLGNIQYMNDNYTEATQKLSDAKFIFEAIGSQHGTAQCMQSLGQIEYMIDHYDEAHQMLSIAQTGFEAVGDQLETAECQRLLGLTAKFQHTIHEAISYFTQAKDTFAQVGPHTQAKQDECSLQLAELLRL